jgi:hypothetical protein
MAPRQTCSHRPQREERAASFCIYTIFWRRIRICLAHCRARNVPASLSAVRRRAADTPAIDTGTRPAACRIAANLFAPSPRFAAASAAMACVLAWIPAVAFACPKVTSKRIWIFFRFSGCLFLILLPVLLINDLARSASMFGLLGASVEVVRVHECEYVIRMAVTERMCVTMPDKAGPRLWTTY